MHGMLVAENGLVLMGADTPNSMELGNNGTVSLSGDDEDVLRGYWEKLISGGVVGMPLEKAPWGDHFGECKDKFGVSWLVNIAGSAAS
ncbi:PhnB [Renibacterium salmoninarum ATCC 33209]|uniref:PhnB n=1 Tax=Renibacterium salmoninarum (strain ATCC 33209 / DSM 20767 / JCM 11484 / NBRC 15589 / NCIMB 2235) TaxID=288705 RepID=A9WV47_RENSM|nr:PhnB [Renibacterium salmoninarum ATCC 33209]